MFLSWGFLPGSHCWASALGTAAFGSQALQLYIFVPYLHISIFVSSIWWDGGVLILMPPCHILSIVVIMLILWISPPVTGTRMVMIPWTDTTDTKNITEAPQTYAACAMPWGRPGELGTSCARDVCLSVTAPPIARCSTGPSTKLHAHTCTSTTQRRSRPPNDNDRDVVQMWYRGIRQ